MTNNIDISKFAVEKCCHDLDNGMLHESHEIVEGEIVTGENTLAEVKIQKKYLQSNDITHLQI